jgi:hypothetical protein
LEDYLGTSLQPSHGDLAKDWSRKLDIDCAHDDTIPALMLSYAAQANENELVLFPLMGITSEQAQAAPFGQLVKRSSALGPQPTRHHTSYPRRGHDEARWFAHEKGEGHEEDLALTQ